MGEVLAHCEGLLLEAWRDVKYAANLGLRKVERYNQHKQLVRLINLMRATETCNTKTIAFQTDGLSAPLWRLLLGAADCSRQDVLSWAKTERMLVVRDAMICSETGSPPGTFSESRQMVLSSRRDVRDDFMCIVSRALGWEVLDESLDNPKSQALRQRLGDEVEGSFAGDLSLCDLFLLSDDDIDISENPLSGHEIPLGFAVKGESLTILLLLSHNDVILFRNERMVRKYLSSSHRNSVDYLTGKKKPMAESLADFMHQASLAFQSGRDNADAYLMAMRFVQKFLSISTANLSRPVDDKELGRAGALALKKDASRLHHIVVSSYNQPEGENYVDLSMQELRNVHNKQASLSSEQHGRVFHDLSWQEDIYNRASANHTDGPHALLGTLSDDDNRDRIISKLYSEHENCIRKKRAMTDEGRNSLRLNLAVMCYNRLTHNEYATVGFEEVLRKDKSTVVCTDKYKAIYTPHSGAAVLYFDEDTFAGLRLRKYQPNKGAQESVLGLVAVLHDQLKSDQKDVVDKEVYHKLQEGLQNIMVVQNLILNVIRSRLIPINEFKLKISELFISVARHTEDIKIRKWLEREVLGFLAFHGVPNDNSTVGFSSMYDAFLQYYQKTGSGIEVTVDSAGNLCNAPVRVCSTSGSYVMCDEDSGMVLKLRKNGREIKKIEELHGRLQLLCRAGSEPTENYIDVYLKDQDMFA